MPYSPDPEPSSLVHLVVTDAITGAKLEFRSLPVDSRWLPTN